MNIKFNHSGETIFNAFNVPNDREGHILVDKLETLSDNEKGLLIGLALTAADNAEQQFAFELSELNNSAFMTEYTRLNRRVANTLISKAVENLCYDYSENELDVMVRVSRVILRHIAYHNVKGGNNEE